jgi:hypothetical protein
MDVRFGRDTDGLAKGLTTVRKLADENKLKSNCVVFFVSQFGRDVVQTGPVEAILEKKQIRFYWFDKPIDYVQLGQKIRELSD